MFTTDQIREKIKNSFGVTIDQNGYLQTIDKNNQILETTKINLIEIITTALEQSDEDMKDDIEDHLEIIINICLTIIDSKNINGK